MLSSKNTSFVYRRQYLVCLLPPVSALPFPPPGNGGKKLDLADEVRAAVVHVPVQDLRPCPSLHHGLGCFTHSLEMVTRTQGTSSAWVCLSQRMTFFPLLASWSKFFSYSILLLKWDALSSWCLPSPQFWGTDAEDGPCLGCIQVHSIPTCKRAAEWHLGCWWRNQQGRGLRLLQLLLFPYLKMMVESLRLTWWWQMAIFLL